MGREKTVICVVRVALVHVRDLNGPNGPPRRGRFAPSSRKAR